MWVAAFTNSINSSSTTTKRSSTTGFPTIYLSSGPPSCAPPQASVSWYPRTYVGSSWASRWWISEQKVRETLVHDRCHAAVWLLDRDFEDVHGPKWKEEMGSACSGKVWRAEWGFATFPWYPHSISMWILLWPVWDHVWVPILFFWASLLLNRLFYPSKAKYCNYIGRRPSIGATEMNALRVVVGVGQPSS